MIMILLMAAAGGYLTPPDTRHVVVVLYYHEPCFSIKLKKNDLQIVSWLCFNGNIFFNETNNERDCVTCRRTLSSRNTFVVGNNVRIITDRWINPFHFRFRNII